MVPEKALSRLRILGRQGRGGEECHIFFSEGEGFKSGFSKLENLILKRFFSNPFITIFRLTSGLPKLDGGGG